MPSKARVCVSVREPYEGGANRPGVPLHNAATDKTRYQRQPLALAPPPPPPVSATFDLLLSAQHCQRVVFEEQKRPASPSSIIRLVPAESWRPPEASANPVPVCGDRWTGDAVEEQEQTLPAQCQSIRSIPGSLSTPPDVL
ncbi:hypothetical protein NQZ68_003536 [Dissostichus eleginoides]|nr:hypothetical protein NQZ68_003536 [Dissostichus eleginoides]